MRPYQIAWVACFFALIIFVGIHFAMQATPNVSASSPDSPQAIAGVKIGGAYTLTDQNGKKVTDKSWPGKYQLVYFGFTHCPDICPLGLNRMADALKVLPASIHKKIQPIFITVDPERDTPKILREYVGLFDKHLIGLTGSSEDIKKVEALYRVYAQKDGTGDDYMVNHSGYTYLMGPKGDLLSVYAHETTAEDLAAALKKTIPSGP